MGALLCSAALTWGQSDSAPSTSGSPAQLSDPSKTSAGSPCGVDAAQGNVAGAKKECNQDGSNKDLTAPDAASRDSASALNPNRPLPDTAELMHAVEANERVSEAIRKDYLYRSVQTEEHNDGHGKVKKTETREYDIFWVEGVPVERLTKKDGKDLDANEQKKENERIDKEVAAAKERKAKADQKGKETTPRGDEEITASRMLELGRFTNARRVQMNGRDTIAIDFAGDPKVKTRSRFEDVVKDLVGTLWVDEKDRQLVKVEGHFLNAFKIGGGLLVNIQQGTSFHADWTKVNDEVWLPAMIEGRGEARALLLFKFDGSLTAVESDYQKFKATSTILPGVSTVEEDKPQN